MRIGRLLTAGHIGGITMPAYPGPLPLTQLVGHWTASSQLNDPGKPPDDMPMADDEPGHCD